MELLDAYNQIAKKQIAKKRQLPPMTKGGLERKTTPYSEPEALWQALTEARPQAGWLQYQSWQGLFEHGLPESEPSHGLLLAADAICADGSSITVNPDGRGGWMLTRYLPQPEGEQLWDEITQIAHDGQRKLRYRRYWTPDPAQGMVQQHAMFRGIDHKEEA